MRSKRKYDPLTLLTLFVIIGVLVSTWAQFMTNDNSGSESPSSRLLGQKAAISTPFNREALREQYREQYHENYRENTTKDTAQLATSTL